MESFLPSSKDRLIKLSQVLNVDWQLLPFELIEVPFVYEFSNTLGYISSHPRSKLGNLPR